MHFTVITALALAGSALGHSRMWSVHVNGVDQGDGRKLYIRSPPNNSPVKDLKSPDMICNVNGGVEVAKFVKAAAGDKLSFEWYHDNRKDDIIAESHMGAIITYVTPYVKGNPTGPVWTKIAEDGYSNGKWAVRKLIDNKGLCDFTLPAALKAGQYIIRQEIIAHHESDATFDQNPNRGAQFYPSCVQIEVGGSGTAVPSQNFDINTGYSYTDPGIHFNLYAFNGGEYVIPGPKIAAIGGGAPDPTTTKGGSLPTTKPKPCPGLAARRAARRAARAAI